LTQDRLLSAIGMCRKAGKLAMGYDAAAVAVGKGAPLVIVTADAADRTRKNIALVCEGRAEILETGRTMQEIERTLGRKLAVAAVTDQNFAQLIRSSAGIAKKQGGCQC